MFVIPLADMNSQAIESLLDDDLYYIIMDWNDEGEYWEMGVRNSAYQTLIDGICVVPNFLLTQQFKYPDIFPGDVIVGIDRAINGPPPRDGFISKRFEFVYIPYLELLTINAV